MMRPSVSKPAPGLYVQREPGWNSSDGGAQARDVVGQRVPVLARDLGDVAVAHRPAAEPRHVGQQVLDRDRSRWPAPCRSAARRSPAPAPRPPAGERVAPIATFMSRN